MAKSIFDGLKDRVPHDVQEKITKSFNISNRIYKILKSRNLTQKQFADLLGKKEPEISKWLSGTHNFTMDTIIKIEAVLNEKIIDIVQDVPREKIFGLTIKLHDSDRSKSNNSPLEQCHVFSSQDRYKSLKSQARAKRQTVKVEVYRVHVRRGSVDATIAPMERNRGAVNRKSTRSKNINIPLFSKNEH